MKLSGLATPQKLRSNRKNEMRREVEMGRLRGGGATRKMERGERKEWVVIESDQRGERERMKK